MYKKLLNAYSGQLSLFDSDKELYYLIYSGKFNNKDKLSKYKQLLLNSFIRTILNSDNVFLGGHNMNTTISTYDISLKALKEAEYDMMTNIYYMFIVNKVNVYSIEEKVEIVYNIIHKSSKEYKTINDSLLYQQRKFTIDKFLNENI